MVRCAVSIEEDDIITQSSLHRSSVCFPHFVPESWCASTVDRNASLLSINVLSILCRLINDISNSFMRNKRFSVYQ